MTRPWRFRGGNVAVTEMTGKTFGRGLVLAQAMSLGTGARWLCRCVQCGHEQTARGSELRRERVGCRGCGTARATEAHP